MICSVFRILDFDVRKKIAPRLFEKLLLTNICQDKFIQRRNSLAFDLLVQFGGQGVTNAIKIHQELHASPEYHRQSQIEVLILNINSSASKNYNHQQPITDEYLAKYS